MYQRKFITTNDRPGVDVTIKPPFDSSKPPPGLTNVEAFGWRERGCAAACNRIEFLDDNDVVVLALDERDDPDALASYVRFLDSIPMADFQARLHGFVLETIQR